jgi:hypothetical protein
MTIDPNLPAAADVQRLRRDEIGERRGKKQHRLGNVFRFAQTGQGGEGAAALFELVEILARPQTHDATLEAGDDWRIGCDLIWL